MSQLNFYLCGWLSLHVHGAGGEVVELTPH